MFPDLPHFHREDAAHEWLEGIVWPDGPVCPYCGGRRARTFVRADTGHRVTVCHACERQFTVKTGTFIGSSHAALFCWFRAIYLLQKIPGFVCSAYRLHQLVGVSVDTARSMKRKIEAAEQTFL